MKYEYLKIEIEGEELTELYPDLIKLEVELDEELAGMFRFSFALYHKKDGTWLPLDDERLRIWKQVVISGGFENDLQKLMTGYITHAKPTFDPDLAQCRLEIWGMDASVLMDREDKLKAWPNKNDSDIAREIFQAYALTPKIEDTEVVHDEAISTVIQRETDMQFLKRLALRNGYECYIEGDKGFFGPPQLRGKPQPVLAVHFGDETNIKHFAIEVNALKPATVAMFQIDRMNKEVLEATAESSQQPLLGDLDAAGLLSTGIDLGHIVIGQTLATGSPEMAALCQGLLHQGEWFVTGEGEIAGNQYAHVLKPRNTVLIKGIGETYSGLYYVTHVTHSFSKEGYSQRFKVKRNALMPKGSEDFSTASGLF